MLHADISYSCSPLPGHPTSHDPHDSCVVERHSPRSDVNEIATSFGCNVCMHVCCDPVVTMCGHLFCWSCLYYQLSLQSTSKECPVCKADVQDKIVPLFGCGRAGHLTASLPENCCGLHIPCRPSAIAPITCTNIRCRRSEPNHAIQHNEVDTGPSAICASLRRFVLPSLPPQNGGFLGRYAYSVASALLMRGMRFSNEELFVLHWVFIIMASANIAFFLAC